MERWNGAVEWTTGLEYWSTGVPEGCGERLTARAHTANSSACSSLCFTFLVECDSDGLSLSIEIMNGECGFGTFSNPIVIAACSARRVSSILHGTYHVNRCLKKLFSSSLLFTLEW